MATRMRRCQSLGICRSEFVKARTSPFTAATCARRVSSTRRLFIVFLVPFLMQLAPPATSQALPDKHPITAVGDPVPQAKLDPEPIRLPIVDGTEIRFRRLSTSEG